MLLLVLVLAVTSLLAAAAYNTATVTNAAQLKITSTNSALVALSPDPAWSWTGPPGNLDGTSSIVNGELFFNFGKGVLGVDRGLQPNSVYEWIPLFELRNMSREKIWVTVTVTGAIAQYITLGTCSQAQAIGGGNPVPHHIATANWGTQGAALDLGDINPINNQGDMWHIRNIAVKISLPSGVSLATLTGTIVVQAVATK
jgi:hypothetical protein